MSREYTVSPNLEHNFNGSTMSFTPKPEYKSHSENKLQKFNVLLKPPNFQNIKKNQLDKSVSNITKPQTGVSFKYYNQPSSHSSLQQRS